MTRRLAALALVAAWPAQAQTSPPRFEAGLQALGVLAEPDYGGAGPWLAWRPAPSLRLGLLATAGASAGSTAGRVEGTGHLLLEPGRMTGAGVYFLAGVAWRITHEDRAFLLAGIGVESAPGRRSGWVVELGVGGGWRATAGYRWRWGGRPPSR
ncbi:MAG TPA: hypothetical protein VJN95_04605 [Gemmatimonadales bacterium]|nr:hypothetical protein [Gemmatimonadales bacterium]